MLEVMSTTFLLGGVRDPVNSADLRKKERTRREGDVPPTNWKVPWKTDLSYQDWHQRAGMKRRP